MIEAIFDGDVFRPIETPNFPPNVKVRLTVELDEEEIKKRRERLLKVAEQTQGAWADSPEIDKALEELNESFKRWTDQLKSS
ncbi:MAG: DUF104 domain-containing protein [Myxococcota bacterium]|nr:DUF104 domain-containing protein [Myxococcota bacterium]